MKTFRPMKAPNKELPGKTAYDKACLLKYPLIGSFKLDGFRTIFYQAQMRTASLKPFNNININTKFAPIVKMIDEMISINPLLDGELIAPSLPFNVFSGIFRSDEMPLPADTKFNIFDTVLGDRFDVGFTQRIEEIDYWVKHFPDLINKVEQIVFNSPEEVIAYYEKALSQVVEYNGEEHNTCDGLILRLPTGKYKLGRGTLKEGLIYKLKPYQTFDAKIISVEEGTNVSSTAEKTINELGYSRTSKKKGDRVLGGWAKNFVVIHDGIGELSISIKATLEEKRKILKEPENYIGRYIEYKGLMIGAKDLPRHPVTIRLRPDKEN